MYQNYMYIYLGVEVADAFRAWYLLFGLQLHGFEPCKRHPRKMDVGMTPSQKVPKSVQNRTRVEDQLMIAELRLYKYIYIYIYIYI